MQNQKEEINVKIGLEIHVPLKTRQKLFCDCPTNYYDVNQPNINTCEVCTGMPGSKPYPLNEFALESAIMISKLLNCRTKSERTYVKRKHYNYPDLPSGYQRTSEPLGVDGELNSIGIWEIHIEEDPGRYDLETGRVDYNRSGVPLVEIVTAPDMKSPEDVRNFMKDLINILKYTERIVDVGGVLRADVNISIENGARVEIKNINSVRGAYKAINYEILRQKNLMKRGGVVKQETRGFNEKSMITISLRVKETADDYRYIPDPDIPPLLIEQDFIDRIELPETPQKRKERLIQKYKISEMYARTIVRDKEIADLFEISAEKINPEISAEWICREVLRQLNYRGIDLTESKLNSEIIIELLDLVQKNEITENTGKKILERIIDTGESPRRIVQDENLGRISEADELSAVADAVIKENPDAVRDYKSGKNEALNFLMGMVMKKMQRRADVGVVVELLRKKLG